MSRFVPGQQDEEFAEARAATSIRSAGYKLDALGRRLRAARPWLVMRVENPSGPGTTARAYRSESFGWDELIDEGYDPDGNPLERPVYWRILRRGKEILYCSTFQIAPHEILRGWGREALLYSERIGKFPVARNETLIDATE